MAVSFLFVLLEEPCQGSQEISCDTERSGKVERKLLSPSPKWHNIRPGVQLGFRALTTLCFLVSVNACLLPAAAQMPTGAPFANQYGTVYNFADVPTDRFLAQAITGTTALPTDIVPLPESQGRDTFGERLQFKLLRRLPSRFYFNLVAETSL